jgi:L-lactate dehydrogenase complex protein LldG
MRSRSDESPNKAAFLQRVREALGRSEPLIHAPDHPSYKTNLTRQEEKVRTINAKLEARRPKLLDRLAETATGASWNVHRVKSYEAAGEAIADIAAALKVRMVARSAEEIMRRVSVDDALRQRGIRPIVLATGRNRKASDLKRIAFEVGMGVTGVTYAIAETASCVVIPKRGVARSVSLAPPVYAAIVDSDQVLENLDDYFALVRVQHQRSRGRSPNYANFISGPSRTADIEQTLTIGVHGPGEVHMILIG